MKKAEDTVNELTARVTTLEKTVIDNRSDNERNMKMLLDKLKDYGVETPSDEPRQYERVMKYIQHMFEAFGGLEIKEIDKREVEEFEGYTVLSIS
jgi:hypothetical protein